MLVSLKSGPFRYTALQVFPKPVESVAETGD